MKKSILFLSVLMSCLCMSFVAHADDSSQQKKEETTRSDAVIFKVHDVNPVSEDGIVTGCDLTVTLYNRTAINFRSFSLNLQWEDSVESRFHFDKYVESILGTDTFLEQKQFLGDTSSAKPLQLAVTVNAFGTNKQISVKSHIDSEKCYLLLSKASYTVSPCDIVRNIDKTDIKGLQDKACTELFQFVDTTNPEYFGQFKKLSATEIANQQNIVESQDLDDIDVVINKIVENLGVSDKTLTDIN